MKNILKISLVLVLLVSFVPVQAQKYRIEAGYIQPNRTSDKMSTRYFHGIRVGGTVDFDMPVRYLGIHTGLLYTYAFSDDVQKYPSSESLTFKTQGHYLDIPIHATATFEMKYDIKLFIFAGPNLNIGLYQPQKVTSTLSSPYYISMLENLDIREGKSNLYEGDLRWFNFQLEAGGGFQWKKAIVKGGYAFGINDLSKKAADKQRQGGWYASFAIEL